MSTRYRERVVDIFVELGRRQRAGELVNVAVVGTGFFGAGLVRRLAAIPGMRPVVAANRTLSRAVDALLAAGFARTLICTTDDPHTAQAALDAEQLAAQFQAAVLALRQQADGAGFQ